MTHSSVAPLVVLGVSSALALAQSHRAGELSLEPYSFRTYDGRTHPAELGHLWVQEDRRAPSKGLIQLGFVRLRSTAEKPRSPVVFLPGGPGIPGTVLGAVPVYFELFEKLQALSDVILLDQRGIGTSSPNTACPTGAEPPADVFATESNFRRTIVARATECGAYWRAKGVSLESFSTASSVEDLEDLRRAIGANKLSLLAHSYGTALGLEFVRRHEEQVDRVVLTGVEGPDESLQMPLVFDFALRRVSDLAASSPLQQAFPDTYHEFQRVMGELDREPMRVRIRSPKTNQDLDVSVGVVLVRFVVKGMLPNGRRVGQVPALVYSLGRHDPSLIKEAVQDLYNSQTSGFTAMQFAVLCADGWSSGRRQLAQEEASHSVFGDVPFIHLDAELCDRMGIKSEPDDSLLPLWSSAHALLISGTLDSNTPPPQAEQVLWGLPHGELVLVKDGFHETLPSPTVQSLVVEFLSGTDVSTKTVEFAPPSFVTISQAAAPKQDNR